MNKCKCWNINFSFLFQAVLPEVTEEDENVLDSSLDEEEEEEVESMDEGSESADVSYEIISGF